MWSSPPPSFLEHLHKHQGSVLHPDYKTAFPSFEDALHRLLPYHVYQGALPSPNDYHKGEASQDSPHRVPGVWRWVARTAEGTSEQMLAQLCKRHCRGGRMRPAPCVSSGQPPPLPPTSGPLDLFSSSAVDEEFETVSTQLLKRTQAMLNKYRLLLLEESRVGWPSPSFLGHPALSPGPL